MVGLCESDVRDELVAANSYIILAVTAYSRPFKIDDSTMSDSIFKLQLLARSELAYREVSEAAY